MLPFDAQTWKDRARRRCERMALTRGKRAALAELKKDLKHIRDIGKVLKWCDKKGIKVEFQGNGDSNKTLYFPDEARIAIIGNISVVKQLSYLLHECGHHLIGNKQADERFGMGYPQAGSAVARMAVHRCDIVDEELEAWHRGMKLKNRLKLSLKKAEYDAVKVEAIRSYMRWAGNRRKKK